MGSQSKFCTPPPHNGKCCFLVTKSGKVNTLDINMKTEDKTIRKLEVCCADIDSIRKAAEGGAHRVELCQDLEIGGTTPSAEMIDYAIKIGIRTHILIRPRGGNFVYSPEETDCMVHAIRMAQAKGVAGVVIGALTPEGNIDTDTCRRLINEAKGMSITFHRAFDECIEPSQALEQIISLGCHRLLTSGHAPCVDEGLELLKKLVNQAKDRIIILPGCGVNPGNARYIIEETGACELHGSLRKDGHTDKNMVRQTLLAINAESLA